MAFPKSVLPSTASLKTSAGIIRKKIGNTLYCVPVYYSDTSKERLEDKIMRLAKNDLAYVVDCGKMKLPQTGRLLEGGSLS